VASDGDLPDGDLPDGDLPEGGSPGPAPKRGERPARDHIFLVIAGLGFDAAMVADTDEDLKAKVGWIAYFVAGIKHLHAHRMRLQVSLDDSPWYNVRLRSLLIGNCGKLPGGITLLPDAVLDDGWLDIGAIDTRVGPVGWGQLCGEVALQRFGVRSGLPNKAGKLDHARAKEMRVRARDPQQIQVDGDIIGSAYEIAARVEPLALTVRVDGGA
jgi:diacylglycerol kinase family enzyme